MLNFERVIYKFKQLNIKFVSCFFLVATVFSLHTSAAEGVKPEDKERVKAEEKERVLSESQLKRLARQEEYRSVRQSRRLAREAEYDTDSADLDDGYVQQEDDL